MMFFIFLCQRLSETVLESFPYNDNLSPKGTRLFGPGKTLLIFYADHLKN